MSLGGLCDIGINTDAGAIPDPELLVAMVRESFAELIDVDVPAGAAGTVTT
jgi:hypothetical protein